MLLNFPIRNEKSSITRPIALKIANDLKRYLEVIPKDVPIIFMDEEGVRLEKGSATHETQEGIYSKADNSITITVSEEYMESSLLQYQHYNMEFLPIFGHEATSTHVTPYYSHVDMKLTFTYKAQSKATARMWLNSIKSKIRRYNDTFPHNLEYHYEINRQIIYILSEVYRLIKNRNPDIENISDWMQNHFVNRFGTISDSAGENKIFCVSDTQQQVQGFFNFDGMLEEGEKNDGNPSWNVSFEYLVRYMKPTDLSIWYPLTVYNQVVNQAMLGISEDGYVNTNKPDDIKADDDQTYYTLSGYYFDKYSSIREKENWVESKGIVIPHWSEFQPSQKFSIEGLHRFVDQMILFDSEDEKGSLLIDLKNPQGYNLKADLIDFLISEIPYLVQPSKSLFQLCMYQNENMLIRDFIKIDPDGKVYLNGDVSIDKTYHLRLGLYHDWDQVDDDAINRLMDWHQGKCQTFQEYYGYQLVGHKARCYSPLYFDIIDYLTNYGNHQIPPINNNNALVTPSPNNNGQWGNDQVNRKHYGMKTVQIFNTTNERRS